MKSLRLTLASSRAAMVAVTFATIITIWGEMSPALKDFLKSISGHHWITKSYAVILIYLIGIWGFYSLTKEADAKVVKKSISHLILLTILGTVALSLFFIAHYNGIL